MALRLRPYLLLIAFASLIYLPFLRNELVWDDEQFIYNNAYVREFQVDKLLTENTIAGAGEESNYYRPLTSISLSVDYQIWQNNPIGFHLTNLILHTVAGLILYRLILSLQLSQKTAFWVSAVFLTHPLQTEAVAYANSRGDSMYALFGYLSLLFFSLLLQRKQVTLKLYNLSCNLGSTFLAIACVLSYAAGILGKEIGIAVLGLHALLLFRHYILFKQKSGWLQQHAAAITFTSLSVLAGGYLALRATVLNFVNSFNFYGESASVYAESMVVRLLTFSKVVWIYLQVLVIPYPLHMERDTDLVLSFLSPWPWLTLGLLVAIVLAGWHEWQRRNSIWTWFGAGWIAIMLAPVSGIIPINGVLYEHWLYTPIVGFALMLYGVVRLSGRSVPKWIGPALLTAWIVLSWRQNYIWSTPERLYTHTLQYAQTGRLHNNLAMAYAADGKHDLAIEQYTAALGIADQYPQIYFNLANTYAATGDMESAVKNYTTALERNPNFEPAYPRLILAHIELKNWNAAREILANWKKISENVLDQNTIEAHLTAQEKKLR